MPENAQRHQLPLLWHGVVHDETSGNRYDSSKNRIDKRSASPLDQGQKGERAVQRMPA